MFQSLSGEEVGINGNAAFAQENIDTSCVVAVLVRDEDSVQVIGRNAESFETKGELFGAEPSIDENAGRATLDKGCVATASTAENCHLNHGRSVCLIGATISSCK